MILPATVSVLRFVSPCIGRFECCVRQSGQALLELSFLVSTICRKLMFNFLLMTVTRRRYSTSCVSATAFDVPNSSLTKPLKPVKSLFSSSKECDLIHGECVQTYIPYLFLVIPLGPVTLTGQDYVLVESGCSCRPRYAKPGTDPNPTSIIPNF